MTCTVQAGGSSVNGFLSSRLRGSRKIVLTRLHRQGRVDRPFADEPSQSLTSGRPSMTGAKASAIEAVFNRYAVVVFPEPAGK